MTITFTCPAECAGVWQVIEVELATFTEVAADPPKLTVAPDRKPVPIKVNDVPPTIGPTIGNSEIRSGGGAYVKQAVRVSVWVSVFVTTTFTASAA